MTLKLPWTNVDVDQTTATPPPTPFLQYDHIRNVHLIADNKVFEMHLKATKREIYIPDAKQTTQT